jgi:hypothetical protein
MKNFKGAILFLLLFFSFDAFCQSGDAVEMADLLRRDGKIYTVVFGLVIILTAMIILLIKVDRRIFRLESEFKKEK